MKKKDWGYCGCWVIAEIIGKSLNYVVKNWTGGYKGYAPLSEVEVELKKYGFKTIRKRAKDKKKFEGVADLAIAFIQFNGDYHHWAEAYRNTHFVLLEKRNGNLLISSNGYTFWRDSDYGRRYLERGYIRSYLIVTLEKR